jgi:MYXO-CTERM domain-containing protein
VPCGDPNDVGPCQPGTQTCDASGHWGACEGAVGPGDEVCDGVDNDCDGETDEYDGGTGDDVHAGGGLCEWGESCIGGVCQPIDPGVPPDENDPNNDDDGGVHAGCGCASGSGGAGGALPFALVALALFRPRRRR